MQTGKKIEPLQNKTFNDNQLINQFNQYHASLSALNIFLFGSHPRNYFFLQHNEILRLHVV